MYDLAIERDGKLVMRQTIGDDPLTIGRSPDNCVTLSDPVISRYHCRIELKKGAVCFTDLSSNGTFVNGALKKEAEIGVGDRLSLGPWTLIVEEAAGGISMKTVASSRNATQVIEYDEKEKQIKTELVRLTIKSPDQAPIIKKTALREITIGHHAASDISVADPFVSRRHCRIVNRGGQVKLIDLASTNGTYVNDVRIEQTILPPRGSFRIGKTAVEYKFVRRAEKLRPSKQSRLGSIVGASESMREVFALMERVGPTNTTVCITGESGTGKELVAREIHNLSTRRPGPFVAINCGAVPASIIESHLFGHERGAFTGAVEKMQGLFEQASGGTIFLDEIGEMSLDLQTRLLRVLESGTVRRIGGQEEIPIDARVIAATNRDLKKLVLDGRFREDLFFRLYVVPIFLPSLNARKKDIRALTMHFLYEMSKEGTPRKFADGALKRLAEHNWPGNVRELKNTIERTLLFCDKPLIDAEDLLIETMEAPRPAESDHLEEKEREVIVAAIDECGNNLTKAAKKLGIARTTIQTKIKRHGIVISRVRR